GGNGSSARNSHSAPPSRVRNATPTSAPVLRMDSWIAGIAAASLGSWAAGQRANPQGANTHTHQDNSVGRRNQFMQWGSVLTKPGPYRARTAAGTVSASGTDPPAELHPPPPRGCRHS